MISAENDFAVFIFDPIALTILAITLAIVLLPTLRRRKSTTAPNEGLYQRSLITTAGPIRGIRLT